MSKYRSTSVHLLGGCNASLNPSLGVCNPNGQIFDTKNDTTVHSGLYVCDASLLPCSLGINPCLTIATLAEHVSKSLVQEMLKYKTKEGINVAKTSNQNPCSITQGKLNGSRRSTVVFEETMKGRLGGMPCSARLKMKMNTETSKDSDKTSLVYGKSNPLLRGKIGGYVVFSAVEMDKLFVIDGEVDMCEVDIRTPYTQYMHYRLLLAASSGSRFTIVRIFVKGTGIGTPKKSPSTPKCITNVRFP